MRERGDGQIELSHIPGMNIGERESRGGIGR